MHFQCFVLCYKVLIFLFWFCKCRPRATGPGHGPVSASRLHIMAAFGKNLENIEDVGNPIRPNLRPILTGWKLKTDFGFTKRSQCPVWRTFSGGAGKRIHFSRFWSSKTGKKGRKWPICQISVNWNRKLEWPPILNRTTTIDGEFLVPEVGRQCQV